MCFCQCVSPKYSKKTCELIVESGNHYIGALKGNQSGMLSEVEANFTAEDTDQETGKGHGRIELRSFSICSGCHPRGGP